jgi:tRNA (cmo5U34)-methyltransferase
MLAQARTMLGALIARVQLHEGYIEDAPDGPFDGATCLLTLHFLPEPERSRTLRELHRRLRPGAPLIVVHHSFPTSEAQKDRWLKRNAAFSAASGLPAAQAKKSVAVMKERLPVLSPEKDSALLQAAGFEDVELFYAGFTFKGWVGYRS